MPTLRPHLAFLYEILRKSGAYFKLRCGQNEIKIRSARGSLYERVDMSNTLSCFVVGKPRSE